MDIVTIHIMSLESQLSSNKFYTHQLFNSCSNRELVVEFFDLMRNDDLFVTKQEEYLERFRPLLNTSVMSTLTDKVAKRIELIEKSKLPEHRIAQLVSDVEELKRELISKIDGKVEAIKAASAMEMRLDEALEKNKELADEIEELKVNTDELAKIYVILGRAGVLKGDIISTIKSIVGK